MDFNEKEERRRQEDMALNRGLLWVAGAIVLELLLMLVKRYYINTGLSNFEVQMMVTLHSVLKGVRVAGGVLAVLCAVWAVMKANQGKRVTLPVVLGCACTALAICAHVAVAYQEAGVGMLFQLVPAWAGLALVYYLYQKEFFLAALGGGAAVMGLWFVRFGGGFHLETILCFVTILASLAAALWLKKNNGVLCLGKTQCRVVDEGASYTPTLVSGAISLVVLAVSLFLGSTAAYYLLFAMVAWLFALIVYYTVKMM